jgi:hypothetical protein
MLREFLATIGVLGLGVLIEGTLTYIAITVCIKQCEGNKNT